MPRQKSAPHCFPPPASILCPKMRVIRGKSGSPPPLRRPHQAAASCAKADAGKPHGDPSPTLSRASQNMSASSARPQRDRAPSRSPFVPYLPQGGRQLAAAPSPRAAGRYSGQSGAALGERCRRADFERDLSDCAASDISLRLASGQPLQCFLPLTRRHLARPSEPYTPLLRSLAALARPSPD
jgi:hypothetical protein